MSIRQYVCLAHCHKTSVPGGFPLYQRGNENRTQIPFKIHFRTKKKYYSKKKTEKGGKGKLLAVFEKKKKQEKGEGQRKKRNREKNEPADPEKYRGKKKIF